MTIKLLYYRIGVHLNFSTTTWAERVKTPNMTKGTLDYPNNMCQSAFDNSLSFKSKVSGRGIL